MLAAAVVAGGASGARACDICAVYTATEQRESRIGPRLGVATQYTHFGTLQENGHEVANPQGERMDSVVTQLLLGWQLTPRVGVQLTLPFIARDFRRIEDDGHARDGSVGGLGDIALLANVLAYSTVTEHSVFRFSLLGGLKLPTGDGSELNPDAGGHHHGAAGGTGAGTLLPRHAGHPEPPPNDPRGGGSGDAAPASGIHGHDLALGSGSVDGIVGGDVFFSWRRAFVTGALQYAVRTEGSFDYQFANDLTFAVGPGGWLWLDHRGSVALQAMLTGETKGNDTQGGVKDDDTAVTILYLGPRLTATWGTSLAGELAGELPVLRHNTGLQIMPDFRIRVAAVWRF